MRKLGYLARALSLLTLTILAGSIAMAQNNTTWVAQDGDDASVNCSFTAPCKTFAVAVSKTANQGQLITKTAGNFGPVTITQSITINGLGATTGIQVPNNANAITISTSVIGDVVHLSGLNLNGSHQGGTPSAQFIGIVFNGIGALVIENTNIENFSNGGINFAPAAGGGELYVRDSTITNNEFFGIQAASNTSGNAFVSIDTTRLTNNGRYATGTALQLGSRTLGAIRDSVVSGSGGGGISAQPAVGTSVFNVESTLVHNNGSGVVAGFSAGTASIRISNTTIVDNTGAGFTYTGGSSIVSLGSNKVSGNGAGNGPPTSYVPQQ